MTAIDRQQIIEDAAKAEWAAVWPGIPYETSPGAHADFAKGTAAALPVIVAAALKPIRELHDPADNDAARTPRCPECLGKAGVHPCGCWRDVDEDGHICKACSKPGRVSEPWPCPTIAALDGRHE